MNDQQKKWFPVIVAVIIAGIVLVWYVGSGRSSLDRGARELATEEEVAAIDTTNPERIAVTCKNGEKYEIVFTDGESNYDDLIFNACGPEGEEGIMEE